MTQPVLNRLSATELFENIRQFLQNGYAASFTVTGNSMWPLLRHSRDYVILESLTEKPLKKGDIVLFMPVKGRYLLHRIDWVSEDRFRTTGDGNCFRDGTFNQDCVVGRVVTLVRKGKKISCANWLYRLASHLWMALFWARPVLLKTLRKLAMWKNTLKQ
jgi:signal peptidase I